MRLSLHCSPAVLRFNSVSSSDQYPGDQASLLSRGLLPCMRPPINGAKLSLDLVFSWTNAKADLQCAYVMSFACNISVGPTCIRKDKVRRWFPSASSLFPTRKLTTVPPKSVSNLVTPPHEQP
jgi:hypothetical protein